MEDLRTFERFLAAAAEMNAHKSEADKNKPADDKHQKKLLQQHGPGVLNADLLKRIHKFIFHPNVKTLEEAKDRHQIFIDAMPDAQS